MIDKNLLLTCCLFIGIGASAQQFENKSWIFLTHKQSLTRKLDLLTDVQLRSADKIKKLQTVLLRAAASYNLNKQHSIALGYAYKGDRAGEPGEPSFMLEHRIYEQYIFDGKISRTELTLRFRLEQRFVEEDAHFDFSQRARGFVSFQIPVLANEDFTKGVYTTFQNEVFVNVTNKENANGSFFNQNRIMASVGYRWNDHIDTEIGYIYWRQKEATESTNSNVIQLMITTKL